MCKESYTLVLRSSNRSYGTTTDYHIDVGRFFQGLPANLRNERYLNGQLMSFVFPDDTNDDTNTADKSLDIKLDLQLPYQTDTDKRGMSSTAVFIHNQTQRVL